jgi:hypothetical protein
MYLLRCVLRLGNPYTIPWFLAFEDPTLPHPPYPNIYLQSYCLHATSCCTYHLMYYRDLLPSLVILGCFCRPSAISERRCVSIVDFDTAEDGQSQMVKDGHEWTGHGRPADNDYLHSCWMEDTSSVSSTSRPTHRFLAGTDGSCLTEVYRCACAMWISGIHACLRTIHDLYSYSLQSFIRFWTYTKILAISS